MPALLIGHRIARSRWTLAGLAVVAVLALAALAAPLAAPGDPYHGQLAVALRAPSRAYLLGTDAQGRDLLSRLLFGARLSLAVGLASQTIAVVAGLALGLAAGFYGRWVDALVMRAADVTLAFPSLLLLIAIAAAVQAARALGASDVRLAARHVLPNVVGPVIVAATLGVGGAIMAEAALSFVGLGAQPPTPSWGAMVADGRDLLRVAPWVSLAPGLAIGLTVLAVNLVGDGLRDALDVRA